jgi:hypothetical protein
MRFVKNPGSMPSLAFRGLDAGLLSTEIGCRDRTQTVQRQPDQRLIGL